MKLNSLLKFLFVFVILAALMKLQYNASLPVDTDTPGYAEATIQPYSPTENNSNTERPYNSRDLIRLEFFLLLLFLITHYSFNFNVFQFRVERIWVSDTVIPAFSISRKQKNRAPPFV